MDNVPDFIYFKDADGRFTTVNRSLARALGVAHPEDALGKTDHDYFVEEYARRAIADEHDILLTRLPIVGKIEQLRLHNGGSGWLSTTRMVNCDVRGEIVGTFGVSRNITEAKLAEEELLRAKEELEHRVAERTAELSRVNKRLQIELAERERAEQQVKRLNQDLERRVDERTAQLAAANGIRSFLPLCLT